MEVEFPTETIELESEFSEEWDNDELFEGYAWKQLYGDEGIATYGTVARSHLVKPLKELHALCCSGSSMRYQGIVHIKQDAAVAPAIQTFKINFIGGIYIFFRVKCLKQNHFSLLIS